jgi:hypothetical protein
LGERWWRGALSTRKIYLLLIKGYLKYLLKFFRNTNWGYSSSQAISEDALFCLFQIWKNFKILFLGRGQMGRYWILN